MLLPFAPAQRRQETAPGTSLGAIADGLAAELRPWLDTPLPIPAVKARLTRRGGRCPVHGSLLEFDPREPDRHRCQRCDVVYTDRSHHEWWAMGAQLFTAERTVHAAALYLLRGDPAHRDLAVRTLRELAARYTSWPNCDNVLGPSRPFFSTYLESIWLLNICHALALLEAAQVTGVSELVRDALLAPSSALIGTYHERRSNRQVWNEAAILSAWTLLGAPDRVMARLTQPGSLPSLLAEGLLADGTWYEGENYHQFAHRGLWYGVQLLTAIGFPLDPALASRFHEGFVAPFAGLLPDETFPSRRDSQYAVSLRQWRWAEWCELGYAFRPDPRLAGLLARLYDGSLPAGPTGRDRSTADAERNMPGVALSRADVSWRALLMATPAPVPPGQWRPGSVVQSRQGLAVLRRERGAVYAGLDGGAHGGGHGHPDRLHVTLQTGPRRWLDDPGTGSYTDPSLFWYRSTLAHHAPLVNGASQRPGVARLTAFEERGGAGWIEKRADDLGDGVSAVRRLVAGDGYLVDVLEWEAPQDVTLTLPVGLGELPEVAHWRPGTRPGAGGEEDGFGFLRDIEEAVDLPPLVRLRPHAAGERSPAVLQPADRWTEAGAVQGWYATSLPATWWRARASGAPGHPEQRRVAVDVRGRRGCIVGVWSWGAVTAVALDAATGQARVTTADGTVAEHASAPYGWHIALTARHARSSIDLERLPADHPDAQPPEPVPVPVAIPVETLEVPLLTDETDWPAHAAIRVLGGAHYVPTEQAWGGVNAPTAVVHVAATADHLLVQVRASTGHPPVVPASEDGGMPENPWDNEPADVNADGLQCYVGVAGAPAGRWVAAVLLVPLADGTARVTSLVATGVVPEASTTSHDDGWSATMRWPRSALQAAVDESSLTFDLVVNERPPERERRRGQLVCSGGGGFGYLRGPRHAPTAPLALTVG